MANNAGQGLLELADLISRREYNWGLVRSRVYEEELVRSYADETGTEYTSLADTIEALWNKGAIGEKSRENLHNIRILGNKAVHEGNNDPQDAKNAYFMLKEELQVFAERANTAAVERTPVMINSGENAPEITESEVYIRPNRRNRETGQDESEDIDMSYVTNRRRPSGNTKSGNAKKKKKASSGIDLYSVLKILIPVLIVILLIILIKSLFPKKDPAAVETTTTIETEVSSQETEKETEETTTPAPTTEAPTTEAPAKYKIKGEGVNIRLADNPDTVYTQLGNGTVIGEVTEFENTTGNSNYDDFVRFSYDSRNVIVAKRFIEKTDN